MISLLMILANRLSITLVDSFIHSSGVLSGSAALSVFTKLGRQIYEISPENRDIIKELSI